MFCYFSPKSDFS